MNATELVEAPAAWRVAAASAVGGSHEKRGAGCQDAHAYTRVGADWVVWAVADGAGSAPLADVGARAAVDRAAAVLAEHVRAHLAGAVHAGEAEWRAALDDAVRAGRAAVEAEAAARDVPARHLASTLLAVVLGPAVTAAAQVGDGATVALFEDDALESLTHPPRDEGCEETSFNLEETTFLCSPGADAAVQFAFRTAPVRAVATLTDGLQLVALSYPTWAPAARFFRPLFRAAAGSGESGATTELADWLISPVVRGRTDDDTTLVMAWRGGATETEEDGR